MTTDDSLLLSDLDRIASEIRIAMDLEQYGDYEFPEERVKVYAGDLGRILSSLRRASREMVTLRERLERRLNGETGGR